MTVMLGGVAGGLVAVAVFEKWVGTYLIEVADSVVLLRDLDSAAKPGEDGPTNPDECIDFVKMCKEDDVVREFQHRLVTMGRKPVMGEYHAAKAWIADKDARCEEEKKMAEAKRACDLMVKAI